MTLKMIPVACFVAALGFALPLQAQVPDAVKQAGQAAGEATKDAGKAAGEAGKQTGSAVTEGAKEAGTQTKDAANKAKNTVTGRPKGSTGQCKDGTYTKEKTQSGACSKHGGVDKWF